MRDSQYAHVSSASGVVTLVDIPVLQHRQRKAFRRDSYLLATTTFQSPRRCYYMPKKTQPCPECGVDARQIHTETVRNMLEPFTNQDVEDSPQYRVCTAEDCDLVYFADERDQQFDVDDVRVRVNFKLDEDERPYPLCYCFGYNKEDVIGEVENRGAVLSSSGLQTGSKQRNVPVAGKTQLADVVSVTLNKPSNKPNRTEQ